ncbi:MlaD family protein [Conexibacter sp. SYSU D00693]|uniref:MlaD family protein n=1 Tax=Conexibacter sp. SYSU D00693 TaxID=2812560 RepID=UPI00196B0A1F|nr:MlaD family protein [Conexibacter sp. SYSU D00693]
MGARTLLRLAAVVAAGLVVVVLARGGGDEQRHRFTVTVAEATNVVEGQLIRQAGAEVGRVVSIDPVRGGRDARLELEVDDAAWPIPRGSRMTLRWGGTANFGNRYIALAPGRGGGSMVQEGGRFPAARFALPVEFDELLATFPERVRGDVRRMLASAGPALLRARPGLRATLRKAPPALAEASALVRDLDGEHVALRTMVRSADRVLLAVDDAQPGVKALVEGAAGTFDAIADETRGLQAALDRAPATFRTVRGTLADADGTLERARAVTARIAPGVAEVQRTAAPLDGLLGAVRRAGPDATATLATARRAVPDVDPLLDHVTDLAPQLRSAGAEAVEALRCIRPFTPEINTFFSNWGDFFSGTDGKDKLIRAQVQNYLPAFSNASPYNAAQAAKLFSGLEYGFPRPPGTNAGQPWFLPECGAGPDALDPNKDPEIRPADQVFSVPKLLPIVRVPREGGR